MLLDEIPKPAEPLRFPQNEARVLGPDGRTAPPAYPTIMARLDEKVAEKITLSKGTVAALTIAPAVLMLVFSYGSSLLGWAREDQSVRSEVQQLKESVRELKIQVTDMQKMLTDDQIQRAKIEGFKAGVAETQSDKGGK